MTFIFGVITGIFICVGCAFFFMLHNGGNN